MPTTTTSTPPTPFHIGVLLIPPFQLLDMSPIDLFGMLTPEYLSTIPFPPSIKALAEPITISYISASGPDSLVEMTANAYLKVTHGLSSPQVAAGKLDALLIPGPDPNLEPTDAEKAFIRTHGKNEKTDILTVCTGVKPAAYSGVLDGKTVTGPRALLGDWSKQFPKIKWTEKRWECDGRVWTSGGITNGQDMVAEYLRTRFQKELAELICGMAEVGGRGQEYSSGTVSNTSWWLWLIFRSWWKGKVK